MKIVQVVLRHKREICTVGVALGIVGVMTGCEKKTQEAPILAQADLVIYAVQEPSVYEPVIKEFEERTNLVVDVCVGTTEELKQMLEHDRTERENREVGKHRNDGSVQSVCKEQTDNQIQESYQEQQKTLDWDLVFGAGVETLEQLSDQWLSCENPQTKSIIQEFASPDLDQFFGAAIGDHVQYQCGDIPGTSCWVGKPFRAQMEGKSGICRSGSLRDRRIRPGGGSHYWSRSRRLCEKTGGKSGFSDLTESQSGQ